ncbi:siderophore-interacting protein [Streptomyces globisporus]|uniref:siderophore-interacting protein n=1 Tax=Streptomyces globisporus TaxID=1908 RepID=UPI0036AC45F4
MSSWVRRAEPGDPAGTFGIGTVYRLPEHAEGQLPAGDGTALPAILSTLDRTPSYLATVVCLEVSAAADLRSVEASAGVRAHWFSRDDDLRPDIFVLEAMCRASLPSGRSAAQAAGESRLAATLRRHLGNDRAVPKRDISFFSY